MWILLRGLGRERRHWFDFPERMSDTLGVNCQTVDLPGFGQARFERVPTSVSNTAEVVLHRLQGMKSASPGPLGVLGLSLGGMVGLELCRRDPERFSHGVVVNSSCNASRPWQRLRPEGLRLLARSLTTGDASSREEAIYALTLSATRERALQHAARAAALTRTAPVRRRDVIGQLVAAAAFTPQQIHQPVLVLSGRKDRLVSPSCSAALAAVLGAAHAEHPAAGHDLPLDDGPWLVHQIRRWLATLADRDEHETLRKDSPGTLTPSLRDEEGRHPSG
jgi:pimeloyl-ACP methyl ester carboxylesterase